MRGRVLVFLLMLGLPAVGPASGDELVYEADGRPLFTMQIPDDWQVDLDFEQEAREAGAAEGEEPRFRVVEIWPRDEGHVWLGVWSLPEVRTLDEGLEYLSTLDDDLFTDVTVSEPEATEFHGMAARTLEGTAKRDGKLIRFAMALFEPAAGSIVAALYAGEPGAWEAYSEALDGMVNSFEVAD